MTATHAPGEHQVRSDDGTTIADHTIGSLAVGAEVLADVFTEGFRTPEPVRRPSGTPAPEGTP